MIAHRRHEKPEPERLTLGRSTPGRFSPLSSGRRSTNEPDQKPASRTSSPFRCADRHDVECPPGNHDCQERDADGIHDLSPTSLGMVLSGEFPADSADAGLETETADDAFQRQILRSLADQRRPDFHLARRIHVFTVQRAQAEPRSGDSREQQGRRCPSSALRHMMVHKYRPVSSRSAPIASRRFSRLTNFTFRFRDFQFLILNSQFFRAMHGIVGRTRSSRSASARHMPAASPPATKRMEPADGRGSRPRRASNTADRGRRP